MTQRSPGRPTAPPPTLSDPDVARQLIQRLPEAVYVTDEDGHILDANPAFLELVGIETLEELAALPAGRLYVRPERRPEKLARLRRDGLIRDYELEIRDRAGRVHTVLDTGHAMQDPASGRWLFYGMLVDITERKELEWELRRMLIRDPLTGCYNRRYLHHLMETVGVQPGPWGAILVDIDNFKRYNDEHGHHAGDDILVKLARFLQRRVRAEDATIRLGGDEFLILVFGDNTPHTEDMAKRLRDDARNTAPAPFSLGWAIRRSGESLEDTVARADRQLIHVRVEERTYRRQRRHP